MSTRIVRSALATALCLTPIAVAASAQKGALRCGWWDNPMPNTVTLVDRHGEWIVSEQGSWSANAPGHEARGKWPTFSASRWVAAGQGSYGYGCVCVRVDVDDSARRVVTIYSAEVRPLSVCRSDRTISGWERTESSQRRR